MVDKAKIATIFALMFVLALLMLAYWLLAKDDSTMTGGFIAIATYLIKKVADEIEEVIDMLWGIKNQPQGEQK